MPVMTAAGCSANRAIVKRVRNMMGDRKKSVTKGLDVAGWRSSRIWVNAHRKPEKKEALIARAKPRAWKAVSP